MAFRGDLDALVLGVLARGRMHGYEITQTINAAGPTEDNTGDGGVVVKEGQLYPILHRLENDGKIEAEWIEQTGRPARKVYRLTDAGRGTLIEKRAAWEAFAQTVGDLLAPVPSPTKTAKGRPAHA